jgi:hypothetical protein
MSRERIHGWRESHGMLGKFYTEENIKLGSFYPVESP